MTYQFVEITMCFSLLLCLLAIYASHCFYACFVHLCHLSHQSWEMEMSPSQNNSVWEGDHTQAKCFSVFFFSEACTTDSQEIDDGSTKKCGQAKAWVQNKHRFVIALLWGTGS